jgi:peptidoglycan/xylan/chitin deacetylase (PgdA/CDA1 family)
MSFEDLPGCYSTLKGFEEYFATGTPILMYHKISARPAGARLKGLYLSVARFEQQMAELKEAGYSTPSLGRIVNSVAPARSVALTFDDGFSSVFDNALEILDRHQFQGVTFLVANLIGKNNEWDLREGEVMEPLMDAAQVRTWLAAGHEIGSHTLTHARLSRLSLRDAQEEISASKKRLEDLFAVPIQHFCYPYGEYDEHVRNLVMEAGYQTACTTEFGINTPASHPLSLKRITARYPSRNLKNIARKFSTIKNRMLNGQ